MKKKIITELNPRIRTLEDRIKQLDEAGLKLMESYIEKREEIKILKQIIKDFRECLEWVNVEYHIQSVQDVLGKHKEVK